MAETTRLQELSDAGVSVWIDSLSREMLDSGQLAALMADDSVVGVTSNPTIFQKALAEGDLLRRAAARGRRDHGRRDRDLLRARDGRHPRGLRPDAPRLGADGRHRRLRLARGRPEARLRPRAHVRAGAAVQQGGRPPEPLRQDPGHRARPRGDRGLHRQGRPDQRHPDLLARALRGRRRGVHPRRSSAWSPAVATRARCCPSRASSSRASTPRPTSGSRRSAAPTCRASSRSRTRSSPTSTTSTCSATTAGPSSPARAPVRSAACGRRPRRRTPPTAT